jgi:hypothetical protein
MSASRYRSDAYEKYNPIPYQRSKVLRLMKKILPYCTGYINTNCNFMHIVESSKDEVSVSKNPAVLYIIENHRRQTLSLHVIYVDNFAAFHMRDTMNMERIRHRDDILYNTSEDCIQSRATKEARDAVAIDAFMLGNCSGLRYDYKLVMARAYRPYLFKYNIIHIRKGLTTVATNTGYSNTLEPMLCIIKELNIHWNPGAIRYCEKYFYKIFFVCPTAGNMSAAY